MRGFPDIEENLPLQGAEELLRGIEALCAEYPAHRVGCQPIGRSEKGRPIPGVRLGSGPVRVSLIAGAHADEPVGTVTLEKLIRWLLSDAPRAREWLEQFSFSIVPHMNPDGAAANQAWIAQWPDLTACLRGVQREPPGRDLEFGYPSMRIENQAVAGFLAGHGPFALHMSLHGMLAATGGQLLINRSWVGRTQELRRAYAQDLCEAGVGLFDYDRAGEKGFEYLGPGFATTPTAAAMRHYFESHGDLETAGRFHQSSMDYVQSLGADPLCLVTELPLWRLEGTGDSTENLKMYLSLRQRLPEIRHRLEKQLPVSRLLAPYGLKELPVSQAVRLQLRALELGLAAVA